MITRTFIFPSGPTSPRGKFWIVSYPELDERTTRHFRVRWGAGTDCVGGQGKATTCSSMLAARAEAEKRIEQKLAKGYEEEGVSPRRRVRLESQSEVVERLVERYAAAVRVGATQAEVWDELGDIVPDANIRRELFAEILRQSQMPTPGRGTPPDTMPDPRLAAREQAVEAQLTQAIEKLNAEKFGRPKRQIDLSDDD